MQNSIILDEYWTFGNNAPDSSARGQVARPTFALSVQDLDNPNIDAWRPKKLKANHSNKALKAMRTKYLISLRNEIGIIALCFSKKC